MNVVLNAPMSEAKTYTGGCHCGKTRFEVTADLSTGVIACNCSICAKRGYLLAFASGAQFKLLSGAETETVYQFGKKAIEHQFCSVCGVTSWNKGRLPNGETSYAINVRCLDGVEVGELSVKLFDGRSR